MAMPDEQEMRRAIATRDANSDGRFVFGVVTTGIYCRPSCAARPAKPENLRFFAVPADAEAAGLRACKRCRPERYASELAAVTAVASYIEAHTDEKLTLAILARQSGLAVGRLSRAFKAAFGVSPRAYQDAARMRGFKSALRAGEDVAGAIFEAGFGSTSRVYGEAARNIGMTPSAYRAGGAGETIWYACRDTALGRLLMAATGRGVCFAQFGDSEQELLELLRTEFPSAVLEPSSAAKAAELDDWITALDAHMARGAPRPDLPLDLRGTAFQMRVWQFLLGIAEGQVISYTELAEGIDKPAAVRAAASACGKNRVAVLVPCHRVLRGDGSLGGYRWGLERKRALLDRERRGKS